MSAYRWKGASVDFAHSDSYAVFDGSMKRIETGTSNHAATATPGAAAASPSLFDEVGFLNGLNRDGTINDNSYWGSVGETAYKWGATTAGTGATITYAFDKDSGFTTQEQSTILKSFALWESVANVHFVEASSQGKANLLLQRGDDGGAYTALSSTDGSGSKLGTINGQALISIDTSVPGFDLSGDLDKFGGYGQSTITHELGHLLGLGHGGAYNGAVDPATQQFSKYDDRMWTTMSYIFWGRTDAKYYNQYDYQGTNWGLTDDSTPIRRQAPHTVMALDIMAIQQLYGVATDSPFDGGTVYGFHSNVTGLLQGFFDFTQNTDPVVTLYNQGIGNTLDLSGYTMAERVDLNDGTFSDVGGHTNNVSIAFGTIIETAITGKGDDSLTGNQYANTLSAGSGNDALYGWAGADVLDGGKGNDTLVGGAGADVMTGGKGKDVFLFSSQDLSNGIQTNAEEITDFKHKDDRIDLSQIDADGAAGTKDAFSFIGTAAFGGHAGELRIQVSGSDLYVFGDTNGDKVADLVIKLDHVDTLVKADFVL